MAFEIRLNRDACHEISRIAREEIDRAIGALNGAREGRLNGIHEARKRFKALRALLRLVAPRLGATFRRENRWYRDVARKLAAAREAQVSLETLDRLGDAGSPTLRREFEARYEALRREQLQDEGGLEVLVADLARARERVARWPLAGNAFAVIEPGLRATYRQGRKGFRRALQGASATGLHEWRKDVKYHRHHLELLINLWPEVMLGAATLRKLSDLLGNHHDLHELRTLVAKSPGLAARRSERDALLVSAGIQSRELEARAIASGGLVYAEKPRLLVARMRAYWNTHP